MERNNSKLAMIIFLAALSCLTQPGCVSDNSNPAQVVNEESTDGIDDIWADAKPGGYPVIRVENEEYSLVYSEIFDMDQLNKYDFLGKVQHTSKEPADIDYLDNEKRDYSSNYEPIGSKIYRVNENYVVVSDGYEKPKVSVYEGATALPTDEEKNKYKKLSYVKSDIEVFQMIQERNVSENEKNKWEFVHEIEVNDPAPTICGYSNSGHRPFSSSDEPVGAKIFRIDKNHIAIVGGISKPKVGIYENVIKR